jgi:hypothetical protein
MAITDSPETGVGADAPASTGVISLTREWVSATIGRAHAVTELAAAEAKLAALSIASMIFSAVLAAGLVFGAWALLVAAGAYALADTGVPLILILPLVGVLHLIAAALAWQSVVRASCDIDFRETRRQLGRTVEPDA